MSNDLTTASISASLVQASRILAQKQVVDGFGHVSARHPAEPDVFLISRSMAPGLVTEADILTIGFDGEVRHSDERRPFLERFIHAGIYSARPEIGAVIHSHSPATVSFSVVPETPLRAVYHMAGFSGFAFSIFEIREVAGDTSDMLIRTLDLGLALAGKLASNPAILMRGHGSTVVGRDIPEAVFRAVYLEANAKIQLDALRLGPVTYLTADEARNADIANAGQVGRAWELWCKEISRLQS